MSDMKDTMANVLTGVLTVCALVVTGLVVRREFFPPGRRTPRPRSR